MEHGNTDLHQTSNRASRVRVAVGDWPVSPLTILALAEAGRAAGGLKVIYGEATVCIR